MDRAGFWLLFPRGTLRTRGLGAWPKSEIRGRNSGAGVATQLRGRQQVQGNAPQKGTWPLSRPQYPCLSVSQGIRGTQMAEDVDG